MPPLCTAPHHKTQFTSGQFFWSHVHGGDCVSPVWGPIDMHRVENGAPRNYIFLHSRMSRHQLARCPPPPPILPSKIYFRFNIDFSVLFNRHQYTLSPLLTRASFDHGQDVRFLFVGNSVAQKTALKSCTACLLLTPSIIY
jgi:hypothetical protein